MRLTQSTVAILFGGAVAAVLVAMTLTSFDFNPEARTAPLLVGVPTSIAAVAMVVRDVVRVRSGDASVGQATDQERDRYSGGDSGTTTSPPSAQTDSVQQIESASTLAAMGWVIGLIALIWLFGLLLASLVFVASFMKIFAKDRWLTSVLYALGTTVVIYFLFGELLGQRLYEGMFGGLLPI